MDEEYDAIADMLPDRASKIAHFCSEMDTIIRQIDESRYRLILVSGLYLDGGQSFNEERARVNTSNERQRMVNPFVRQEWETKANAAVDDLWHEMDDWVGHLYAAKQKMQELLTHPDAPASDL